MYNSSKLDPPRENDVVHAQAEWEQYKKDILEQNKYPMFSWSFEPDETIEVKFLSGVKFDIIKTIEIMNNLFAERQLWLEYRGNISND